ncbi:MAG: MarR family winged helix-turn-helix transcriptional regulator [Reyranellaceae bacterium]
MSETSDVPGKRAAALARLFELASRQTHARAHAESLYPAQWAALRYFRDASGHHATTAGLARYQGLALGAVARTVRTLVTRGLLQKTGLAGRGRAELVELTAAGAASLQRDPLLPIAAMLQTVPAEAQAVLAETLEKIVGLKG